MNVISELDIIADNLHKYHIIEVKEPYYSFYGGFHLKIDRISIIKDDQSFSFFVASIYNFATGKLKDRLCSSSYTACKAWVNEALSDIDFSLA